MSAIFIIAQGALFGIIAGDALPGNDLWGMSWEFIGASIANSVLTVLYAVSR